jgi:hypothetical protein
MTRSDLVKDLERKFERQSYLSQQEVCDYTGLTRWVI